MIVEASRIKKAVAEYPDYSLRVDTDKLKGMLWLKDIGDQRNIKEAFITCAGCLFLKTSRVFAGRLIECTGIEEYNPKAELDLGMLEDPEGKKISIAQEQALNLSSCGLKGLPEALTALRR